MKFGIFYEHQLPRPWNEDSEYELLQNSLDQIELADRLGYDYAWEVEHHFLEEYSHSSAPEVFLGAASQRTQNIRLGHGIVQLTTNHPARVAERVSTLDLLSRGRVELGLGESATTTELHPFDVRFRDKRAVWEDAVRACLPMFWNDAWEYHGEHFDFPLRNVIPKPRQKPHPPLVGRLLATRDDPHGGHGAAWARWVSSSCRPRRPRRGCTRTTTPTRGSSRRCASTRPIPTSRSCRSSCARRPTRRPRPRPRVRRSSSSRSGTTPRTRRACPARSSCGRSTWPTATPPPARRPGSAASSAHPPPSVSGCASSRSRTSTR